MAHYHLTQSAHAGLGHRIVDLADTVKTEFAKWRMYRRTVNELQALSTRELTDLNIGRGQIRGIARESVYGPLA